MITNQQLKFMEIKMLYKKRANIVSAFQMDGERRWDNSEWPQWLHEAWNKESYELGALYCPRGANWLYLHTINGVLLVSWGDYIIKDKYGELSLCGQEKFDDTYEVANRVLE